MQKRSLSMAALAALLACAGLLGLGRIDWLWVLSNQQPQAEPTAPFASARRGESVER